MQEAQTQEGGEGDLMAKDTEEEKPPGRGPQPPRISVTVSNELRRKLRIAAARADLEVPEWCKLIVSTAAARTVRKLYGDDEEE